MHSYYHRKDPNYFEDIPAIPKANERLSTILNEPWTIKDLIEMEDEVIANAGVDVFAIDFDERAVRVARTLNLIAGDGQTNVLHLNTLDYERWSETKENSSYVNRNFEFDILMANPTFAGDIKES